MPRGVNHIDEARHQGRLWTPTVPSVGLRLTDFYAVGFSGSSVRTTLSPNVVVSPDVLCVEAWTFQFPSAVFRFDNATSGATYALSFTVSVVSTNNAYVRVTTSATGASDGTYNSGDIGVGAVDTTFTAPAATFYVHLFRNSANGYVHYGRLSIALNSASQRDKDRMAGYMAHAYGLKRGLAASHPSKNRPPLIGD